MSMTGLARLTDSNFTINVNGTMSDSDSSGRNPYFGSNLQEKEEDKEEAPQLLPDSVDVSSMSRAQIPGKRKVRPDELGRFFASFCPLFLPFQVPISLQ